MTDLSDTLIRFRADLESAVARDLDRRRRRVRVARPLAAAAVLAVVGGVLAATLPGGGGPSIVDRAQAALATGSNSILHMRIVSTLNDPTGGSVRTEEEEWALSDGSSGRWIVTSAGGNRFETAGTGDLLQLYDPSTNTIYSGDAAATKAKLAAGRRASMPEKKPVVGEPDKQMPAKAQPMPSGQAKPQTPDQKIRLLLDTGALTDDGHATVGGRDVIRLVGEGGAVTYLVDAQTFAPVEFRSTEKRGPLTVRFVVYELVPASAENRALLSLTAQHPGATVDSDPTDYRAALSRLSPKR